MIKEKKIPTILGLFILIGGLTVGVFLNNKNTNFVSKASGDCTPKNPQITNITNNSIAFSFVTESSCLSTLLINDQIINNSAVLNSDQKSKIHYFDVTNLSDDTEYEYSFVNDGKTYPQSLKIKTAEKPTGSVPSSNLAWGRVFTPELKSASKVMLFINIPGASPLSALVTSSGNWNISLANSFNESKNNRFNPIPNTSEEIIVIDQEKKITQISANTSQNNPVPDIILGQNQFASLPITFNEETNVGFLPSITPVKNSKELDILNPKDNESLSTKRPDFFGTGPINSKIKIEVHSPIVYNGEVTTKDDGSWNWSPPKDLTPGEHTITVAVIENGVEKIISRKFTILATDNPLSYSASSSANTPTPSPTLNTTPIPSIATETTPIITLLPTKIPTLIPTIRTTNPSTSSGVPVTGNFFPTFIILILAFSFSAFSFYYFKK